MTKKTKTKTKMKMKTKTETETETETKTKTKMKTKMETTHQASSVLYRGGGGVFVIITYSPTPPSLLPCSRSEL